MARNLVRVPIIALDYNDRNRSIARELIVDYDNKKIYAKSKDGLTFIGFNEVSDNHIANEDIHVTKAQKDAWDNDTGELFDEINRIDEELALKSPIKDPTFTGVPKAPTVTATNNTTQLATTAFVQAAIAIGNADKVDGRDVDDTKTTTSYLWTAAKVKSYVDSLLASNDAMIFKGTLGVGGTITALPTTNYGAGWSYKIITAGTYAGVKCEVGDLIICIKDYVSPSSNADWSVVQTNIDGAVTNSNTTVSNNHIAIFDGTTGKVIKTSGKALPAGELVGTTSYGTNSTGGVVKSSSDENKVNITNGIMEVNNISVSKLTGVNLTAADINNLKINSLIASPGSSLGKEIIFEDLYTPGPKFLLAGDRDAGYFGLVPATEIMRGDALATALGITQGTAQEIDTPWIKYIWKNKICFTPLKTIRHSVSWDAIYNAGCIYGDDTIGLLPPAGRLGTQLSIDGNDNSINTSRGDFLSGVDSSDDVIAVGGTLILDGFTNSINNGEVVVVSITTNKIIVSGKTLITEEGNNNCRIYDKSKAVLQNRKILINDVNYRVRAFKGSNLDLYTGSDDSKGRNNEWNWIMLQLHEHAELKNWTYSQFVDNDLGDFAIHFTDVDMRTHYKHGYGALTWCQEVSTVTTYRRVRRGHNGASYLHPHVSWAANTYYGLRPVLELSSL